MDQEAENDDVYGGHTHRGSWACNAETIGFGVAVFGNGFVKRTEREKESVSIVRVRENGSNRWGRVDEVGEDARIERSRGEDSCFGEVEAFE